MGTFSQRAPFILRLCVLAAGVLSSLGWASPIDSSESEIVAQERAKRATDVSATVNPTTSQFSGGGGCNPDLSGISYSNTTTNATSKVGILPSQTFYTFPDNYQPENIKQRTNGALLVTINSKPLLYQIDPTSNQTGDIIVEFAGYTSLFGIVESGTEDVFYVVANNFTGNPDFWGIKGTNSIWKVDMRDVGMQASSPPNRQLLESSTRVEKVVDIPEAGLLDGLTLINAQSNYLVTGDAQNGTLWMIDAPNQNATAMFQNDAMAGTSPDRNASLAHVGINGIKFSNQGSQNLLYWTNTAKGEFWSMPMNPSFPLLKAGSPTLIESRGVGTYLDEFSLDFKGNAYICEPLKGVRFRSAAPVGPGEDSLPFVAEFNANSNTFGRLQGDKCTLYVTVNGRVSADSPAPMNLPPALAKVDTSPLGICTNNLVNTVQQQSPGGC